jgi:hypothetical protein
VFTSSDVRVSGPIGRRTRKVQASKYPRAQICATALLLKGVTGMSGIDDRECHSRPHGQQLRLHGTQPRQEEKAHQWRDIPHTAMGMRTLSLGERSGTCPSAWPDMKQPCLKGPLDSHVDPFVPGIDDRTVSCRSRLEDVSADTYHFHRYRARHRMQVWPRNSIV